MLFILSVDNQMKYAQAQLDKLKKTNVFNSTFHIWWVDSLIILWAFMFQNHDCYSHSLCFQASPEIFFTTHD